MIINSLRRQRSGSTRYQACELSDITVLVGPNNAGKTRTLLDIRDLLVGNREPVIFDDLTYSSLDSIPDYLEQLSVTEGETSVTIAGQADRRVSVDDNTWKRWHTEKIHAQTDEVMDTLGPVTVQFLDASSRLQLATNTSVSPDSPLRNPQNMPLSLLYRKPGIFEEFRTLFEEVFDEQPVLDYSEQGQVRICVGKADTDPPEHPRELREFIQTNEFVPLDETGDGFISFGGVIGSLLISQGQLMLLDEPSAFLHPAQARRLGEWIAEKGTSHAEQIVLTTHNANFLNGILDATTDVTIYRLNRGPQTTSFNKVSQEIAQQIVNEPILRSQRVLEAAFRQGAIICEGSSDRATYETVARVVHDETNIQVIDSIGKGKMSSIASVVSQANIPVAAVVDLDVFKNVSELNGILRAAGGGLENNDIQHVLHEFNEIKDEIDNDRFDEGIESLDQEHRIIVEEAIKEAKNYHVYIIPSGEVESWIDLDRKKGNWLEEALEVITAQEHPERLEQFIGDILDDVRKQYYPRE